MDIINTEHNIGTNIPIEQILEQFPSTNVLNEKLISEELLKLNKMIESSSNLSRRHDCLMSAYIALLWIRNPDIFATPSSCITSY